MWRIGVRRAPVRATMSVPDAHDAYLSDNLAVSVSGSMRIRSCRPTHKSLGLTPGMGFAADESGDRRGVMLSRIIAGLGITAVLFVPAASAASASSLTVVQAIEAENKIIEANPEYTSLQHFKVKTVAEAKKAIPKIEGLKTALDDAATAVSQASATTSSQKAGQKDWGDGGA